MVVRLICTIIILVITAVFCGYNLDNRCNVWMFAKQFENIPVFVTVIVAFAAGVVCSLPAIFFGGLNHMTPEQARALADRLEERQKKDLAAQVKKQKLRERKREASVQKAAKELVQRERLNADAGKNDFTPGSGSE